MDVDRLIRAVRRRLAGEDLEGARRDLSPFARSAAPPAFAKEGLGKARRLARAEAPRLIALLASEDAGERHAAAWLLGRSNDPAAVDPLFAMLSVPRDWMDPDYALDALGALGDAALPSLLARALVGSDAEAALAVRAMGHSKGDALPCLERVRAERRPLPAGLYVAYETLGDPLGLPDVMRAVEHEETRTEALGAAEELLVRGAAAKFPRADRAAWAERLASFASSEDLNERAMALVCLGRLGVPSSFELVAQGLDDPEDDVVAAAASALLHLDRGRGLERLERCLAKGSRARRALVAATLFDHRLARGPRRALAIDALLDELTAGADSWANERALLALDRHRALRDALLARLPELPARRQKRAAEVLVELAHLGKRPSRAVTRWLVTLDGSAKGALERAWGRAAKEDARIEEELAALRACPTPSGPPR